MKGLFIKTISGVQVSPLWAYNDGWTGLLPPDMAHVQMTTCPWGMWLATVMYVGVDNQGLYTLQGDVLMYFVLFLG